MGKVKDSKKAAPAKEVKPVKAAAAKVAKPVVKKVANGKKSKKEVSSESESEDSEDSSESEEDSDDDSSAASDSSDVEMAEAKPVKVAKKDASTSDSDDSDDSASDSSDDEESSDKSEEEPKKVEAEVPSKKRKAEEEDVSDKKAKVDGDVSEKSATLWVGNLGWGVDDNVLFEEFKEFNDLLSARVVTDKETGRSRGFGYVDFASPEVAEKAYNAKNGSLLEGRDMRLDFAQKPSTSATPNARAADRASKHGDVVSPPSDTLFVGNLSFNVSEDSVSAFFNEVCAVSSLRIPTDMESGRPKGFAYVSFASIDDAKTAFEALNGSDLDGRSVRLDYAKARDPNGGGRGGGDRGGRGGFSRGGGGFQGKKTTF
ncbi:hypothetical protein B0T22DRAFT_80946 [Podospora appendiculata]|uniref:RRM domain-containing protein n=1 Tax=Podospora appendiculata TaxID=314037 RepID=A0AAE0XJU7_9PEZI|nr:hypothetical protein B0T22DRAFT_80946 [Podospora appendiculata]